MPPVRRLCDAGKPRERRDREPHQRRRARARASCDTVGRGACQQDPDIVCANPPVGAATPRPWLLQRAEPRTRAMPACDRASSASAAQPQRTARPPQDCSAPCAVARRRRARAVRRRDALRSRRGRAKVREVWRRRARANAESPRAPPTRSSALVDFWSTSAGGSVRRKLRKHALDAHAEAQRRDERSPIIVRIAAQSVPQQRLILR